MFRTSYLIIPTTPWGVYCFSLFVSKMWLWLTFQRHMTGKRADPTFAHRQLGSRSWYFTLTPHPVAHPVTPQANDRGHGPRENWSHSVYYLLPNWVASEGKKKKNTFKKKRERQNTNLKLTAEGEVAQLWRWSRSVVSDSLRPHGL